MIMIPDCAEGSWTCRDRAACACVRACMVRAFVHACMCACVRAHTCVCVCARIGSGPYKHLERDRTFCTILSIPASAAGHRTHTIPVHTIHAIHAIHAIHTIRKIPASRAASPQPKQSISLSQFLPRRRPTFHTTHTSSRSHTGRQFSRTTNKIHTHFTMIVKQNKSNLNLCMHDTLCD